MKEYETKGVGELFVKLAERKNAIITFGLCLILNNNSPKTVYIEKFWK